MSAEIRRLETGYEPKPETRRTEPGLIVNPDQLRQIRRQAEKIKPGIACMINMVMAVNKLVEAIAGLQVIDQNK